MKTKKDNFTIRFVRCLDLHRRMLSGKVFHIGSLAQDYGVDRRTILRDITALNAAGYGIMPQEVKGTYGKV